MIRNACESVMVIAWAMEVMFIANSRLITLFVPQL